MDTPPDSLDAADLFQRHVRSLAATWQAFASAAGGDATFVRRETYFALRHPLDVLCNAVLHRVDDVTFDELAELFRGRPAWPLWTADEETADAVAARGFVTTETTIAMGRVLSDEPLVAGSVAVELDADPSRVLELNEVDPHLVDNSSGYRAFITEDDASGLLLFPHGDDVNVSLVATRADRRGHGLAAAVTTAALAWARDNGAATATLQAVPAARTLYERVGFEEVGRWQEWSRSRRGGT